MATLQPIHYIACRQKLHLNTVNLFFAYTRCSFNCCDLLHNRRLYIDPQGSSAYYPISALHFRTFTPQLTHLQLRTRRTPRFTDALYWRILPVLTQKLTQFIDAVYPRYWRTDALTHWRSLPTPDLVRGGRTKRTWGRSAKLVFRIT